MVKMWIRILTGSLLFAAAIFFTTPANAQTVVFPEWTQRFDGGQSAAPHAIATDSLGNSYVTGTITATTSAGPDQEMMTVKYDSDGHLLWKVFLSSPAHFAHGWDVGVDSSGNVYVLSLIWLAQTSAGDPTDAEFTLTKYNPSGARLWFAFFKIPGTDTLPGKLVVTSSGLIFVNGTAGPSTLVTQQYDSNNGNILWQQFDNGRSVPAVTGLGVDSLGILYSATSFVVDEYSSGGGNFLRSITPDNGNRFLGSISKYSVDADGNSYMAINTGAGHDGHFTKFDTAGTVVWDWVALSTPSFAWHDIAFDPQKNAYAVGAIFGVDANGKAATNPPPNQSSFQIVKVNASGTVKQRKFFNGHADASGSDQAIAVATNSTGDVYVTGSSSNAAKTQTDIVTLKYDHNLNLLWQQRYHGPGAGDDAPVAMKGGGDGGLFLTGSSHGSGTGTDWVTIDYIQDGASLSPTSLTFASQALHTTSAAQNITVKNTSETDVNVQSITTTGDFHQTNTCPPHLGAGLTCTIHVTFTPTATGTRKGTLTFLDDWEGSPRKVSLSGTGH
jgi:hypothetical protein